MRTSEERINELHRRMNVMEEAKRRRGYVMKCAAAYAVCLAVIIVTAIAASGTPVVIGDAEAGAAAASIFARHGQLGYLAVGIMAFCLGALTTVLCFRLRKRTKEKESDDRTDR